MDKYKGLPLINLDIIDDLSGIDIISLVDRPAVEREFIAFSEQQEVKFAVNEEKRIVTGVALIPGQKIYRKDEKGEYYIQVSKDAVERIAQRFFEDHNSTNVNLQHYYDVDGCVYFESYLTNKQRNIYPTEFGDLPDGTWIVSCKINNDTVWDLVKKGVLRGFSIEGNLNVVEAEDKPLDTLEELIEYLNNH